MEINGKVYRNLEGQVGYLTDKYDDLQNQINDVRAHLTHYVEVDTLPTGDDIDPSAVYLLGPMGTAPDQYYEEWVYVQKADESWVWEKLGDTDSVDLSGYLEKDTSVTTYNQLYRKNANGTQSLVNVYHAGALANSVVARNSDGQIVCAAPTASDQAATKGYVDTNFLAKQTGVTTNPQVYSKAADGTQENVPYSSSSNQYHLVQRTAGGQINVPQTPTADGHAASKKYVDDNFLAKQTATSTYNKAYVKADDGTQTTMDISRNTVVANAIVQRTANGQITCADPTDSNHAATKNYVDAAVGQLLYLHEIDLRYTISASITLGIKCYLVNGDSTAITSLTRAIFRRITPSYGALNPDASDTVACAITKMPDTFRQDEFDEPYASFLYQYYSGGSLTSGNTFGITPTVTDMVVSF